MTQKTNPWTFDVRVRERNLKAGTVTDKDVEKYLSGLPDLADQSEAFGTSQPALLQPVVEHTVDTSADADDEDDEEDEDDDQEVAAAAPPAEEAHAHAHHDHAGHAHAHAPVEPTAAVPSHDEAEAAGHTHDADPSTPE